MIIPMYKYSFLIHPTDYNGFMAELKSLGVLHIIEHDREPSAEMQEAYRTIKEVDHVAKELSKIKEESQVANTIHDGAQLSSMYHQIKLDAEQEQQQIALLNKELHQLQPWGHFDRDNITRLADVGIKTWFFSVAEKEYDKQWEELYPVEIINDIDGIRYFVVIGPRFMSVELSEADEMQMPSRSISELESELTQTQQRLDQLKAAELQMANGGIEVLKQYSLTLQDNVATDYAGLHTTDEIEGNLKVIEGWVPQSTEAELIQFLDASDVLYLRGDKIEEGDKPPILLKNNWFARLFEPIGKLYSLPNYGEMDLTPFFAPFFMLFFGFCFGDAGYGLLLIIAGFIARPRVKPDMKPLVNLIIWLSAAAVLFGSLTGTFFGAKLTDIQAFEGLKAYMVNDQQMFNLALYLGVVQIVLGMIVHVFNIIRTSNVRYSFSTIGWIIVIVSSIAMFVADTIDPAKGWMMGTLHLSLLGVAALGIFIFNDPKRNIFANIGAGIWDTYNMVTGIAGDVLSYIRLFALGLSSGILGMVFNQLAFNLTPDVPVLGQLITALILLFGHSLNIFMSILGSFVHPMRLTFVEFYKNAGFTGGGKAYSPFKKIS